MYDRLAGYTQMHAALKSMGSDTPIRETQIGVHISDTGYVKEIDSNNFIMQLTESDCALILQRQPVTKILIGNGPNEKFIAEHFFY
ncbi:hypothetical protein [Paenibacillus sp. SN-8-1]|uniref:hypothetical protein n=1 Tax=Paenibacillus sp. SN-8-1 TaxID=3435409 RepID=UPI003D9A332B